MKRIHKDQTYGIFMTPVTRYSMSEWVQPIKDWADLQQILEPACERSPNCKNIKQIGKTNKILKDLPELRHDLLEIVRDHNESSIKYNVDFDIVKCYLEVGMEDSDYTDYTDYKKCQMSNWLFSGTFFINYEEGLHTPFTFIENIVRKSNFGNPPITSATPFNQMNVVVPFKQGDVLIYPNDLCNFFYKVDKHPGKVTLTFHAATKGEQSWLGEL